VSDCGNVQKAFIPTQVQENSEPVKPVSGFQVSDKAAEKIKHFCSVEGHDPNEYGLKVSVVKDGCSGNSYTMALSSLALSKENGDKIFSHNGAYVMVEKLSYLFVIGSILDYKETLLASGFELVNPNVKKTCSCGSSFAV
jgi:iron-sulfur cluster assembly protein